MLSILLASNLAFASPRLDDPTLLDPLALKRPPIEFPLVAQAAAIVDRADDLVHIGLILSALIAPGLWTAPPKTSGGGPSFDLNSKRLIEDPRTWSPPPKSPTLRFTTDLGDHDALGILVRSRW